MSWRTGAGAALAVAAAVGTGAVWRSDPPDTSSTRGGPVPAAGSAQLQGETLFVSRGCAGCHSLDGGYRGPDPAPGLHDASEWAGERVPGMTAEEYVAESIRDPGAFISPEFNPGQDSRLQGMPDLGVSEEEIAALVAYLLED